MNAASPGVIAVFQPNEYYPSRGAYLVALADAMRSEYEAIVAAGLSAADRLPGPGDGRHIKFRDARRATFWPTPSCRSRR